MESTRPPGIRRLPTTFGQRHAGKTAGCEQGHAAQNFSRLSRIALNLLKAEKQEKVGIKTKRLTCG